MRVDMGYLEYMRHKTGQNKAKKMLLIRTLGVCG